MQLTSVVPGTVKRCPGYLRYVDDFVLFNDSNRLLNDWREAIIARMARFRLTVHENEAQVAPVRQGIPWLGWVTYPDRRRLKRRNWVAFARRMRGLLNDYAAARISFAELDAGLRGWIAHADFGDTWRLRQSLFEAPWSARIGPRLP